MRITSGVYKGKKLHSLSGDGIRPTSDMVKQAVFNVIQFDIAGTNALDLFCGSGAMGIEALSRGCKSVVFNDHSRDSIGVLKKNLDALNAKDARIYCLDYKSACSRLEAAGEKFGFIFIDPPYGDGMGVEAVERCASIAEAGAVIIHEYRYSGTANNYRIECQQVRTKKYGSTAVDFIYL